MAKPDVTLEPSKGVVSRMAAQIYAAYIARGVVKDGEEASWMERSIREAVRIAKTVAASVESEDEPDSNQGSTAGGSGTPAPGASASSAGSPTASGAADSASRALEDSQFDDVVGDALPGKSD